MNSFSVTKRENGFEITTWDENGPTGVYVYNKFGHVNKAIKGLMAPFAPERKSRTKKAVPQGLTI